MTGRRQLARQQAERYGWPAAVRGFLDAHGLDPGPGLPGVVTASAGGARAGEARAGGASARGARAGGVGARVRGWGGSPP